MFDTAEIPLHLHDHTCRPQIPFTAAFAGQVQNIAIVSLFAAIASIDARTEAAGRHRVDRPAQDRQVALAIARTPGVGFGVRSGQQRAMRPCLPS